MVSKSNLDAAQKEYVPGKENAFADFLSQKNKVGQTDNEVPTTSNAVSTIDKTNVVETWAKTRQKLAALPQTDLEVPETLEEEKIVDPAELPNQDQWPFTQQQIPEAQKVDPALDQARQKVQNQAKGYYSLYNILHREGSKASICNLALAPRAEACAASARILTEFFQLIIEPRKQIGTSTTRISITSELPDFCTSTTTFNCLVSTVYNLVCINDSMIPEIIKHLRELRFCGIKIISIHTEQVSGYRYAALQKIVFDK
uniref:Uncharacterized protein n=1 Tax=Romanomermis culicivorax TaxID=13658 RepID=A0A915K0H3_ROMCU